MLVAGVVLWMLAIACWRLRHAARRFDVLLPVANIAWWSAVITTTGHGASPWVLGILLEVGVAAMRLSGRACAAASLAGVIALAGIARRYFEDVGAFERSLR